MGIDLDFIKGSGPKIFNPIKDRSDILRLKVPDPQASVPATLAALKFLSKHELLKSRALIGFAGAPFTLSSYILEGESSDKLHVAKVWMYQNKSAWHELQEKLTEYISNYLIAQAEAGADILQLFDSWLGYLSPSDYAEFVEPYLMKIFNKIRSATTVPIIFFATGCSSLFSQFKDLPIDVLGVDWRMSLSDAAKITDNKFVLQGNLDPLTLFAPSEKIEAEVKKIMAQSKNLKGHIFNLGHGIIPKTPLAAPELVLRAIRDYK
jgi:uroporphyrinogen decarboxylase